MTCIKCYVLGTQKTKVMFCSNDNRNTNMFDQKIKSKNRVQKSIGNFAQPPPDRAGFHHHPYSCCMLPRLYKSPLKISTPPIGRTIYQLPYFITHSWQRDLLTYPAPLHQKVWVTQVFTKTICFEIFRLWDASSSIMLIRIHHNQKLIIEM